MAASLAQTMIPQVASSGNNLLQMVEYYSSRYWYEYGDPRLHKSTLLGGGPGQMLAMVLTYLTAVKLFGPYMMRKRKPMDNLIWLIRAYNGFMVLFNAYLFTKFTIITRWGTNCWGCSKSIQRLDQEGLIIFELTLLSSFVPVVVWLAGKLSPTPMIVFAGYINLPIHVIMYSYYGLSTFPSLRQYLWWKKYLTTIQIIQFVIATLHSLHILFIPNCKYHFLTNVQTAFSITFFFLFCQFYLTSYIKSRNVTSSSHKTTPIANGNESAKQISNIQCKKSD